MCAAYVLHVCEEESARSVGEKHGHHLKFRNEARIAHQRDGERDWKQGELVVSAGMMRIFLLPQLPQKRCIFTSRLAVYNETFSLVGKRSWRSAGEPRLVSVLWHEGVAGRDASDVASTFVRHILTQRDTQQIVIWPDNCTAQNKNWMLITGLLQTVNNPAGSLQKITLKFLQKGHTSMPADAVHQVCCKGLKRRKVVADMEGFKDAISLDRDETRRLLGSEKWNQQPEVEATRRLGQQTPPGVVPGDRGPPGNTPGVRQDTSYRGGVACL